MDIYVHIEHSQANLSNCLDVKLQLNVCMH